MSRVIFLLLIVTYYMEAYSYKTILDMALNSSANLKLLENRGEQIYLNEEIKSRTKNPNLEMELSSIKEGSLGVRVGITQEVLVPSFRRELKNLSSHKIALTKEQLKLSKLEFIYLFNLRYIEYKESILKRDLERESLVLLSKIFDIANKRFSLGSISKSDWLQVKIDRAGSLTKIKELEFISLKKRGELLRFANLDSSIDVEVNYRSSDFTITQFGCRDLNPSTHPEVELYRKGQDIAQSELELASYDIDTIELFSEIESEPKEDIFRVGLSIPIPLIHHKSEERELAKIELQNQSIEMASKERAISIEIEQLQNEIRELRELKVSYQNRVSEQQELLNIYTKAYSVAQVKLIELIKLKEELLESRRKELQADMDIEKRVIKLIYLQGGECE